MRYAFGYQERPTGPVGDRCVHAADDRSKTSLSLVKPGSVHRRLYTDPAIFELEMERIFGTAWIYIGHESQVKKPGDYFAHADRPPSGGDGARRERRIARDPQPVRPPRRDGGGDRKGQRADEFTCCYHGWTYHLDGRLKAVPLNHGYPRDFEAGESEDGDAGGARA